MTGLGDRFGRYDLIVRLGLGGMAEVFLAKADGSHNTVALKRILRQYSDDREFQAMFTDEAKISASLNHPNIAQVFEFGAVGRWHFIAMEFVHGQHLEELQRSFNAEKPMPIPMLLYLAEAVCDALAYAHARTDAQTGEPLHIVHRDISPRNILISYEGAVKLIDFGIAKAAVRAARTSGGAVKGKFAYMSPEQVTGDPVDHRSDIFSLGILLYELATGTALFHGENDFNTMDSVLRRAITPPSVINPDVPLALEAVIQRALSRDLKQRYQRAEEMSAELEVLSAQDEFFFDREKMASWMKEFFFDDFQQTNWYVDATAPGIDTHLEQDYGEDEATVANPQPDSQHVVLVGRPVGGSESNPPAVPDELEYDDAETVMQELVNIDSVDVDSTEPGVDISLLEVEEGVGRATAPSIDFNTQELEGLDQMIVRRVIENRVQVPVYPLVATKIQAMLDSGMPVELQQLASLVAADQALSASLLRTANSSAYEQTETVVSIEQAIERIGVAQSLELISPLPTDGQNAVLFSLKHRIWQEAVVRAAVCEQLAGIRGLNPAEAYCCGLLRDFGRIVAVGCIEGILDENQLGSKPNTQWLNFFENYQMELALVIGEKWKLPAMINEVFSTHGRPQTSKRFRSLVMVVVAADNILERLAGGAQLSAAHLQTIEAMGDEDECRLMADLLPRIPAFFESLGLPSPFPLPVDSSD